MENKMKIKLPDDTENEGRIMYHAVEKEMNCKECGKKFKYKPNARFPRKYCDKCSKERKKAWDNRHEMKFEDGID